MKKYFTINIPKPCNEDWDAMTPITQGRHCLSCEKTVVDFTQMEAHQIQVYLSEHSRHSICGRIQQKHLAPIQIEIPAHTFSRKMSFHKIFLLALLISMGTSLLSCSNETTEAQKIESVAIVASEEDIQEKVQEELDTLTQEIEEEPLMLMGIVLPPVKGDMRIVETGDSSLPFIHADQPPEFQDMPQGLTLEEKRGYFEARVRKHITTYFVIDTFDSLALSERVRMYAKFTITETGNLKDIQIRAPHSELEEHAIKIIQKLPIFKPAMHQGAPREVIYMVPIIFQPS